MQGEKTFFKYSRFQCTKKIAQYFRFAEKSGDNHPKHFRKLIMKKSVVTRMNLRSDKDVETYLLKSRSDDNEKMNCYRQFNRGFNFYKENYITFQKVNYVTCSLVL
jgi:hypothetical protein